MLHLFNVYISGAITGLKSKEEVDYRYTIKKRLENGNDMHGYKQKVCVFNPIEFFNYIDEKNYISEKQVMNYELDKLRKSDLIIVDFKNHKSLGTMSEMSIAYEHRIPIIGLNLNSYDIHPWQKEMCDIIFYNYNQLISYIIGYYLV